MLAMDLLSCNPCSSCSVELASVTLQGQDCVANLVGRGCAVTRSCSQSQMGPAGIVKLQRNESNSRLSRFSDACCFLSCSSMLFLQILSRWDIPFLNYHPVYFVNLAARRLAPQWFWMTRLFMGLQVEFVSHVPLDKAVPGLTFDTGVVFVWSPADNDHQDRSVVMCFFESQWFHLHFK